MLLYTAGYAHWTVPALAAELTRLRAVCVDVRMYPVSQRPAWGGADLQAALEASGVSYVHLPALGNPNAGTGGPLALAHPDRGIPWLLQCLKRQPVVVLCQCPDWRSCHRSLIVAAVQAAAPGIAIAHLEPPPPATAPGELLALTLYQPYAALVVAEALKPGVGKHTETRSRATTYRGWLAIHAAKGGLSHREMMALIRRPLIRAAVDVTGVQCIEEFPRGAVVAVARVRDCVPTEQRYPVPAPDDPNWHFGDYTPGRWGWELGPIIALPTPIPATGRQFLWRWQAPPEVWARLGALG